MSSPEPDLKPSAEELRREARLAYNGPGCLFPAGLAVISLFLSVIGLCAQRSPVLWVAEKLGNSNGAVFMAVLLCAAAIYALLYGVFRMLER